MTPGNLPVFSNIIDSKAGAGVVKSWGTLHFSGDNSDVQDSITVTK